MIGPVQIAREAWGPDLPDWVEALAAECASSSQNRVAARMGRSAALISQVLRRKYPADLTAIEEVFRGVFQNAQVHCPALGNVPMNECQEWRRKARNFASGNPLRVRMFRACAACPRNSHSGPEPGNRGRALSPQTEGVTDQ